MLNPFGTRGMYTDTLLQLEIAALSIQIHDLTDDVLMYWHSVNTLTPNLPRHLVVKVCGPRTVSFYLSFNFLDVIIILVTKSNL